MNILFIVIDCISLAVFAYGLSTQAITQIVHSALLPVWISVVLCAQVVFFLYAYRYFFSSALFQRIQVFRLAHPMLFRQCMFTGWVYAFFQTIATIVFIFANDVFTHSDSSLATVYLPAACIAVSAIAFALIAATRTELGETMSMPFWMYVLSSVIFPLPTLLLAVGERGLSVPAANSHVSNRFNAVASIAYNCITLNVVAIDFAIAQSTGSYTLGQVIQRIIVIVVLLYVPYYFLLSALSARVSKIQYVWYGVYILIQIGLITVYV